MGCASSSLFGVPPPRVAFDNLSSSTATLIQVERRKDTVVLLDVVQVLGDLNLSIVKGFISSDNGSFIDVLHVTDQEGKKLSGNMINYIQQSVEKRSPQVSMDSARLMKLELRGTDQPGLLSEVFTVIADLQGNVVDVKLWTHNGRYAMVIYFKDEDSVSSLSGSQKAGRIEGHMRKVIKGDSKIRAATASATAGDSNTERRLHQLMFVDHDYDSLPSSSLGPVEPMVSVEDCWVRGYTVVMVVCKDRQKLLFDILCALAFMDYVIFHATMDSDDCSQASMELSIRNKDGNPISLETEKQNLIRSLQAAIQRRDFQGMEVEVEAQDRRGLLADFTRTLKDEGLNVTGAVLSSANEKAANRFYVTPHAALHPGEAKAIEEKLQTKIGSGNLKVKLKQPSLSRPRRG